MYNFNEELCRQLSNGDIAVHYNNGNLEMLRALLKKCAPDDDNNPMGTDSFYLVYQKSWCSLTATDLSTVPISDFVVNESEKEFVWTDELVKEYAKFRVNYKCSEFIENKCIDDFKASKQRKPLFTTEDGKEIFEGDEYWFVAKDLTIIKSSITKSSQKYDEYKDFSTEAAALEFVRLNKPLYSLNLISTTMKAYNFSEFQIEKIITELEKLKQ